MGRKLSGIFSRIAAALEKHAVSHPTHFPALGSAMEILEGEEKDQLQKAGETVETKDDQRP